MDTELKTKCLELAMQIKSYNTAYELIVASEELYCYITNSVVTNDLS